MSLTTYSGLSTYMERLLNRTDQTAYFPDFLALAEAHFNREIRSPLMEVTSTSSTTTSTVALPTDCLELRKVVISGTGELVAMAPAQLHMTYTNVSSGAPKAYTVVGTNLLLGPAPSAATTISISYFQKIPALTASNTVNWLLTAHPDLYVWALRYYAAEDMMDEGLSARCMANVSGIIESIRVNSNKRRTPAGPMSARSHVFE